jgi:hypothetical protein
MQGHAEVGLTREQEIAVSAIVFTQLKTTKGLFDAVRRVKHRGICLGSYKTRNIHVKGISEELKPHL